MSSFFFFGSVLGIYAGINIYLFARLCSVLKRTGGLRVLMCTLLAAFALSFPLAVTTQGKLPPAVTDILFLAGSLYIAPMIYGFILTLCADVLRILNRSIAITPLPPPFSVKYRIRVAMAIFFLSLIITAGGAINAHIPTVVANEITLDSSLYPAFSANEAGVLRIAMLSDIHIGRMVGNDYLEKLVDIINERHPDLVLMVGDIIDDTRWMKDEKKVSRAKELLSSLSPRLGVWAVTGNHEHYAGVDKSVEFLKDSGIGVLRDEWVLLDIEKQGGSEDFGEPGEPGKLGELDKKLLLVGREDLTAARTGGSRKALRDIMEDIRTERPDVLGYPVILLDHQPVDLQEASDAGIALQLSGHTHRGQLWPFNLLVASLHECHYGLYMKGATSYVVSSGVGTWGPPVRTVGRPEIVAISLVFE